MSSQIIALMNYDSIEEAFPDVDPGLDPSGDKVLVQIRTPKKRTAGGIMLPEETRETELWNTQIAKVIAIGPAAFKHADGTPWAEGDWCKPGDYVRVPKYGGDRFWIPVPGRQDQALFCVFKHYAVVGRHKGDPLSVVAFI